MIQGSEEWFAARLGKATASRMADIMARTKTGYGAARANYEAQLIAERLTGQPQDSFTNAAMQWGTDTEPLARSAYVFRTDAEVAEIGFIDHPTIPMSGASPDGLIDDKGMLEIKCPNTATHIDTLMGGTVPKKYLLQMQWQMACCLRDWCDFVSFDPRLPESMRMFIQRVEFDPALVADLEKEVTEFLRGVDEKVAALTERYAA